MKYLCLLAGVFFATQSLALECTPKPSCESLGFTDTDCSGEFVACPFDQNKKICVSSTTCKEYDCSAYSLSSCPTTATSCTACGNGLKIGYKVNGCKSGYTLSGATCVASTCSDSDYPLASCPTGGLCTNCTSGSTTKYKLNGCQSSYAQDGNTCYDCNGMLEKLSRKGTGAVYAHCGYISGNSGCGYTVFGPENLPFFIEQNVPSRYETRDCCKVGLCLKARDRYEELVEAHNKLCPDKYKVQTRYTFGCTTYIPASSTSTNGVPPALSCPSEFDSNATCVSYSGSYY